MESNSEALGMLNPCNGRTEEENEDEESTNSSSNTKSNPKVVVIMGPTGSGKSKLAIDLASHFPIEIINADSMQIYEGLDVLTNKVPFHEQKGVPHHLLGTISPTVEFTAKDFRDAAIPLINDICSRNCLPVIVGGTNYYIQALVSHFLLDDSIEDPEESFSNAPGDEELGCAVEFSKDSLRSTYDCLQDLDKAAASRIHPNDHRKINQYIALYARTGVLPSKLLQGKAMENWGRVDSSRYNCCFLCVDASLPALDQFVDQRVDRMIDAGLLNEVYDIYTLNADYTRGLRQAIGVREFEDFLSFYLSEGQNGNHFSRFLMPNLKRSIWEIFNDSEENTNKPLFKEAVDKVKQNTRRFVRRQKRRLSRLQSLFGWNIHYVDATEPILSLSDDSWARDVVESSVHIISSFLERDHKSTPDLEAINCIKRDLWTQYICEACGNRVLRGLHEWEQHVQGRCHRKRISRLRKCKTPCQG